MPTHVRAVTRYVARQYCAEYECDTHFDCTAMRTEEMAKAVIDDELTMNGWHKIKERWYCAYCWRSR